MIGRAIGIVLAFTFTVITVSGIVLLIVLDFVGEDRALALASSVVEAKALPESPVATVVEELPALAGAKDITFFTDVPVTGLPLSVNTGVRFATPADLAANIVASRWCYISALAPDGISRRIELATQEGEAGPVYQLLQGLPSSELSLFKLGATALEALAKSHCRFDFTSPASASGGE